MSVAIINGKEYRGAFTMAEDKVWSENEDRTWSEAIPYPLFVGWGLRKARCECGEKFKSLELYQEHYRAEHNNPSRYKRTPTGFEYIDNPELAQRGTNK